MDIQKQIEECETTEHELYVSVGLNSPVEPSVFKECIDNFLSDNIRVKSWGVHTKDEYIGIIDEQQSIISQQTAEIKRLQWAASNAYDDLNQLSSKETSKAKEFLYKALTESTTLEGSKPNVNT